MSRTVMRWVFPALASLVLVAGCGHQPGWTLLGASPDDSIFFYYDPSTIRRERDIASVWELSDYPTGHTSNFGVAFRSKKELNRYNCRSETFSLGMAIYFDGNMGSGNLVASNRASSGWIPAPPATVWDGKMKIACEERAMDRGLHGITAPRSFLVHTMTAPDGIVAHLNVW
jgi:hypothetical protein